MIIFGLGCGLFALLAFTGSMIALVISRGRSHRKLMQSIHDLTKDTP